MMLAALVASAQTEEWKRAMDEGAKAELLGEYLKAGASYEKASEASAELAPTDTRRVFAWNSLATMYDALGRFADAERAYRRGLREAEQARGISSPEYSLVLENLATLYLEIGDLPRAEKLARQALAFYQSEEPREDFRLAVSRNCLAEILTSRAKYRESEALLREAVPVLEKDPLTWSEAGIAINNLAVVRYFRKDYVESERLLVRALDLIEQRMGPDHPMLIRTLDNLASLDKRAGRIDESGARLRRAMGIAERRLGVEHPLYGMVLASYADYLRRHGGKTQAKAVQARSLEILKDTNRRNGIGSLVDVGNLMGR
jgi:tetratricopeptide (TPR) repeat protein